MPALPPDLLSSKYTLRCTWEGCDGEVIVEQNHGVGWKLGQRVPMDPTNQFYARCPKCKRHNMEIIKVPTFAKQTAPKGFTKVPTE